MSRKGKDRPKRSWRRQRRPRKKHDSENAVNIQRQSTHVDPTVIKSNNHLSKEQIQLLNEKELIYKRQSSLLFSQESKQHIIQNQFQTKQEYLNHLFDQYTSETISQHWKPLTIEESIELYQHAYDRYASSIKQ